MLWKGLGDIQRSLDYSLVIDDLFFIAPKLYVFEMFNNYNNLLLKIYNLY